MSPQYDDGNDKLDWTARGKIKEDEGHDNKSYVMISTLTSTVDKNKLDSIASHKTKDNDGHDNKPYAKIPTPTSASDMTRHRTKDNDGHDNYPIVRIATPASVSDKARRKTKDSEGHDNYHYVNITTPTSASKDSTARHKTNGHDNNPYCQVPTPTSAPDKRSRDKVFEVLNRCGKKVEDVTRIAGGIKDHLKFSPSIREAAMARLAQGTKMVVEGGPKRVFQREFGILAAEKLVDSFTCYISTPSGPVNGMLYISNKRIAFCSDFAIRLPPSAGGTGVPAHYKVVLELGKISSISSSSNVLKPYERYAHVVTRNGYVYWFMGFVSYNDAFNCLNKALLSSQSVL